MAVILDKGWGRYPEAKVKLSKNEEDRAMGLHERSLVFDLHMHSLGLPKKHEDFHDWFESYRPAINFEGLKKGGIDACFDGISSISQFYTKWDFDGVIREVALRMADVDHNYDAVIRGLRAQDATIAKKEGKTALYGFIENAGEIGYDLDKLDFLYGMGIRGLTLAYNRRNQIASGRTDKVDAGLSDFGLEVVARMNEIGMIVDSSHASADTGIDAANASKDPIIHSHGGAQGVYPTSKRMMPDAEIQAIAEKGGIIGIHTGPNAISDAKRQTIDDVMKHLAYIVKLVGVDYACMGTDNFFGDKNYLHEYAIKESPGAGIGKYLKFNATHIEGFENPTEWPNITRALVKEGYSDQEIQKIIGLNTLRVTKKVVG
jgi:membrane dipeptidase